MVLDGEEDVSEDALRLVRWRLVLDSTGGSEVKRLWGGSMVLVLKLWSFGVGVQFDYEPLQQSVNMVAVYFLVWSGNDPVNQK